MAELAAATARLKRRLSPTRLAFFTPAATSFNPKPYSPNPAHPAATAVLPIAASPIELPAIPASLPVMDPSPADPSVVFIHPPFTDFPGSDQHPEGLSYTLLAANPEWFLDSNDFQTTTDPSSPSSSSSTGRVKIPYPSQLEPPRGWCPAKKKDLKERGADGWPEGEEPRLRCTFCRRTYAGVNAKSMWRRHVFEKHKIAMSNRRDNASGGDRSRGRGSNKENRAQSQTCVFESQPSLDAVASSVSANRGRFRSLLPASKKPSRSTSSSSSDTPSAPVLSQHEFSPQPDSPPTKSKLKSKHTLPSATEQESKQDRDTASYHKRHHQPTLFSPPLTPALCHPMERAHTPPSSEAPPTPPTIAASPYDPTITPSFKHTTPRLPSDQPWRFPSPSHPLHSRARELSLAVLVHASPKSGLITGSPGVFSSSPLRTPHRFSPASATAPVPLLERLKASPFARAAAQRHARTISADEGWLVGPSVPEDDPFVHAASALGLGLESGWSGLPLALPLPPTPTVSTVRIEAEGEEKRAEGSPVLRAGEPLVHVGLGLLEPFELGKEKEVAAANGEMEVEMGESEVEEMLMYPDWEIPDEPQVQANEEGRVRKRRRMSE